MKGAARISIAAAWLALCSADAQVYLRGRAEPLAGIVESVGGDGVHLRGAGPDGNQPAIVGWDAVRRVEGEFAERAGAFAELSEQAWRARARLERGDIEGAEPAFERLASGMIGQAGPTSATVFEGLMRCRLRRGAIAAATPAWLDWLQARADKDVHPAIWVGGHVQGIGVADERTRLVPALAPVWLRRAMSAGESDGGAKDASLVQFDDAARWSNPATAELAMLYRSAARCEAGLDPQLKPPATAGEGVLLVRDIVVARAGAAQDRAAARDRLAARLNNPGIEPWLEAWCRVGIGRSLILEGDDDQKRLGAVQLLHLPAHLSRANPHLAGIALAEAAVVCAQTGDVAGAQALRAELSRAFRGHAAEGWPPLNAIPVAPDRSAAPAAGAGATKSAGGAKETH